MLRVILKPILTPISAKKTVEEQGGKITHESKLYKGFKYVLVA